MGERSNHYEVYTTVSEIDIIKQEAIGLGVDDEDRIECPFCKADERSMKIHRYDTGIYYHCFRASCPNGKGFTGSLSPFITPDTNLNKFTARLFTRQTFTLAQPEIKHIHDKYDITFQELIDNDVHMTDYGRTYVFSLFTHKGNMWGRSTKARFKGEIRRPKALTYPYEESVSLAYIRKIRRPPLAILTEGMFDAIKVHRYGQGVCLLGTNFNMDMAMDLKKNGYSDIIIALDRDAYSIATSIKKKFSLMFDTMRIARLSKDPKDLLGSQLKEELEL